MHMFLAFPQKAALGISQATLGILASSLESGRWESTCAVTVDNLVSTIASPDAACSTQVTAAHQHCMVTYVRDAFLLATQLTNDYIQCEFVSRDIGLQRLAIKTIAYKQKAHHAHPIRWLQGTLSWLWAGCVPAVMRRAPDSSPAAKPLQIWASVSLTEFDPTRVECANTFR